MKTYYHKKDIKNKMRMKYIINFFDGPTKNDTIDASGYEIKNNFVNFYVDIPPIIKVNVASYRADMIIDIKMEDEYSKVIDRIKKLNSLENKTFLQRIKNMINKK